MDRLTAKIIRKWERLCMRLAGLPGLWRLGCTAASMFRSGYKAQTSLARIFDTPYAAPSSRLAHHRVDLGKSVFLAVTGSHALRMLFDTGSAEVLLHPATARAIGLTVTVPRAGSTIGFATLPELTLDTQTVRAIPSIVHMLPRERQHGASYDGIVGTPFLKHFRVTIDYPARRLHLQKP